MKLVCGITTKNEEWIINKTLDVVTKICDKVIILDDNSEDKTKEICKKYKNVEWHVREKRKNKWDRKEAEGLFECFKLVSKHNPDYILFLDADEIPTPSFIEFLDNIDTSVNAWSVRFINLFKEGYYRKDNFISKSRNNINNDPFKGDGWRKVVLLKYNKDFNYEYDLSIQKGGTSANHPLPKNIPGAVKKTELFYVIHYGKMNKTYTTGEKDKFYALIESKDGKGTYEERLKHHESCRTGAGPNGIEYVECPKDWFWN